MKSWYGYFFINNELSHVTFIYAKDLDDAWKQMKDYIKSEFSHLDIKDYGVELMGDQSL